MDPSEKTTPRIRGNTAVTVRAAQQMRREMTLAEATLWQALRGKKLGGLRFRSQHPVGPFILDFFCPAVKLAVEVDGPTHEGSVERDSERTAQLNSFGYKVVRFTNEQVLTNLDWVLTQILVAARPLTPDSGGSQGSLGGPLAPNPGGNGEGAGVTPPVSGAGGHGTLDA